MKEIVDEIVKAEKEARLKVEEARKQARKLSTDKESIAHEEAQRIIDKAKADALRIVEEARESAKKEREEKIAQGEKDIKKLRFERKQYLNEAVEEAFRTLIQINI